jgi:2-keto-myo-inositol isomerase
VKISYNESCTLKNSTLERDLALCEDAGFSFIELRIDKLREYLRNHTRDQLQSFFRKNKLMPYAMVGIHAYKELFSDEDDESRREQFLEDFWFGCEILCAVGAKNMIVAPPLFTEDENCNYTDTWQKRLEDNVRIFSRLSEMAKNYSINLGIKIIDAPRCSVRTVQECNAILDAVGTPNVGYTLDPFNFYLNKKDDSFTGLSELYPDRIFVVHVNGADGTALEQSARTYPDTGVMNVGNYLKALQKLGYDGPVSLDISRDDEWKKNPEDVIHKAAFSMREILRRNGLLEG